MGEVLLPTTFLRPARNSELKRNENRFRVHLASHFERISSSALRACCFRLNALSRCSRLIRGRRKNNSKPGGESVTLNPNDGNYRMPLESRCLSFGGSAANGFALIRQPNVMELRIKLMSIRLFSYSDHFITDDGFAR